MAWLQHREKGSESVRSEHRSSLLRDGEYRRLQVWNSGWKVTCWQ